MRIALTVLLLGATFAASGCDERHQKAPAPLPSSTVAGPVPSAGASSQPTALSTAADTAPEPEGPPKDLNVLLLTIDSLRSDMPWNGYKKPIAPNLTALAEAGIHYANAYSASSYTAKSVSAMLAGRYPSTIYRSGTFFAGFPDSNLFFTEVLQEHNVRTLGGHAHSYFDRGKNLNQGFDEWELTEGLTFNAQTDEHVTSDKMTDLAVKMLSKRENVGGQFFMWLHYMDPHDQYVKHAESPDFGKDNRGRYDSEIWFTDFHIGRLLDFAKKQPWWKRTAVIVSADHGEAFGEHGMYKHAFELWEELTHVPLLILAPGAKAQTISERRSLVDLAPTVLELMGISELPSSFMGRSLVAEVYGKESPSNREPIILDLPEDTNNPERHAIIEGDYKLIVNGPGVSYRLFNLVQDPDEKEDLSRTEPNKLAELTAVYKARFETLPLVKPYGGSKLRSGKIANGPRGPKP